MFALARSLAWSLLALAARGAVTRIEDQSPLLDYVGSWTTASAGFFSAGTCRWTSQRADKVVYTGSNGAQWMADASDAAVVQIALVGITGRYHAAASVWLDGAIIAQLQTNIPEEDTLNVTVWQSAALDPSVSHTVQVRCAANALVLIASVHQDGRRRPALLRRLAAGHHCRCGRDAA